MTRRPPAGSIERRGCAWRVSVYVGLSPTGSRRYVRRTVHGRRADAEAVRAALVAEHGAGTPSSWLPRARAGEPRPFDVAPIVRRAGGLAAAARELGMSPSALCQAARRGLTEHQADELAGRLGLHPSELW